MIIIALSYFDSIISGNRDPYTSRQITDKHVSMLLGLFNHELNDDDGGKEMQFDDYLLATFKTFIHHKAQIVLDYNDVDYILTNSKIRDIIMYPMAKSKEKRDGNDTINLFKPSILQIFTKVKSITLNISNGYECWSISLVKLLSIIKDTSVQQVHVSLGSSKSLTEWIKSEWESSEKLTSLYKKSGFTIQYKERIGWDYRGRAFVIERNLDCQ